MVFWNEDIWNRLQMAVYISYVFSRIIGNLCRNRNEMGVFVKTCSGLKTLVLSHKPYLIQPFMDFIRWNTCSTVNTIFLQFQPLRQVLFPLQSAHPADISIMTIWGSSASLRLIQSVWMDKFVTLHNRKTHHFCSHTTS